jgi:hypothetical protein
MLDGPTLVQPCIFRKKLMQSAHVTLTLREVMPVSDFNQIRAIHASFF